ncbi:MAG: branched-chain amino acid ABC transporter permease [Clostridiales bacterium]|nr:branched-chain amino acid ABC transporter permease [Clostridiales bacterium]
MLKTLLNVVIGGLIMGGIYALISMGLSIQYGVARILNVSHGEIIMVGALLTWTLQNAGVHPFLALLIGCPLVFAIGFVLHRTVYKRLRDISPSQGAFEGNAMLVSFGVMYVIANIGMFIWSNQQKGYNFMTYAVNFLGTAVPANRLVVLLCSLVISVLFYLFLTRSRLGKAIRAASQDASAAALMGVKITTVAAICFGIGALLAGMAGALLSMIYQVNTTMGMGYTVIAIIVVVLGGMGSIPGSMLGGFILGMIGSAVSYYDPSLSMVAYYVIIMVLLLLRPKGLLGR